MEKYGVAQSEEGKDPKDPENDSTGSFPMVKESTQAPEARCPWCNGPAERAGQTLFCPTHGTAPWE